MLPQKGSGVRYRKVPWKMGQHGTNGEGHDGRKGTSSSTSKRQEQVLLQIGGGMAACSHHGDCKKLETWALMFQTINNDSNKRNGNNFKTMYNPIRIKIYKTKYYSAIKKEWNNAICSNMDRPRDCHTERSKSETEKDKHHMISLICRI